MKAVSEEFVLDASFALKWCFELNGLGKGVTRNRVEKAKAILFWHEMQELPVTSVETHLDEKLLEIALKNNLAIYDASYLSLAVSRGLPIATVDGKLLQASFPVGLYARVSTHDQHTLPLQMRAMREYAAKRGWAIAAQINEVGSGAVMRELREKLLAAARRREIDVVLV